jgi:lipid-A-disaccharide synthase
LDSCLIIAGEKSGEEHAMSFLPELVKLCPDVKFYGVGGEDLKKEGMELLYHLKDFSSMGFSEVIQKVPFYFKALKNLENEVVRRGTKTAIVVDFQDFNMRLAEKLKKIGVSVL